MVALLGGWSIIAEVGCLQVTITQSVVSYSSRHYSTAYLLPPRICNRCTRTHRHDNHYQRNHHTHYWKCYRRRDHCKLIWLPLDSLVVFSLLLFLHHVKDDPINSRATTLEKEAVSVV